MITLVSSTPLAHFCSEQSRHICRPLSRNAAGTPYGVTQYLVLSDLQSIRTVDKYWYYPMTLNIAPACLPWLDRLLHVDRNTISDARLRLTCLQNNKASVICKSDSRLDINIQIVVFLVHLLGQESLQQSALHRLNPSWTLEMSISTTV